MYWLHSRPLEKELSAGTLPESSKFLYYLIPSLLGPPGFILALLLSPRLNLAQLSAFTMLQLMNTTLVAVIVFFGYRHCFRLYSESNQTGFIESATILSFPLSIRLTLLFLPLSLLFSFYKEPAHIALIGGVIGAVYNVIFFLLLGKSLGRLVILRQITDSPSSR